MQKIVTIQKLMPQTRLLQTTAKLRLTFNIPQLDELFPAFQAGDFAVMYGSQSITSLMAQLCIRAPLLTNQGGLESKVIFIDAANSSTMPSIRRAAERQHVEFQKTVDQIQTFRAYTAYRLHSLVIEELEQIIKTSNAKLVVISDVMCPFLTENVDDQEARTGYNQIMNYLSNFAKKHNMIIIATNLPHENNSRNRTLQEITSAKADTLLRYTKTQYTNDIELEKHPTYMLGVIDFSPENKTLTDF